MFKQHERKWDQSGIKQMVKITVPKKVDQHLTKDLSPMEVDSRLKALASTLDSHGWAVKSAAVNVSLSETNLPSEENDDRLAGASAAVQIEPELDIKPADDILDEVNNPVAQKLQSKMKEIEQERKEKLIAEMKEAQERIARIAKQKQTSKSQPAPLPAPASVPIALEPAESQVPQLDEQGLLRRIHQEQNELLLHPPKIIKGATRQPIMTTGPTTVNMELANSGSDLSVATISNLANRTSVAG